MLLDSGHIHFFVRIYIQILTNISAEVKVPVTVEQINTVNTIKEQLFPTTNVPESSNQDRGLRRWNQGQPLSGFCLNFLSLVLTEGVGGATEWLPQNPSVMPVT